MCVWCCVMATVACVCLYPLLSLLSLFGGGDVCVQYPALTQVDWEIYFGRGGMGVRGRRIN